MDTDYKNKWQKGIRKDSDREYSRVYNLLKESGICERGLDSFISGYGKFDDRMGVLRDDGSLWLWDTNESQGIERMLDFIDYCTQHNIRFSYSHDTKMTSENERARKNLVSRLKKRLETSRQAQVS